LQVDKCEPKIIEGKIKL